MRPPTITLGGRILLNTMTAALVLRLLRLDDLSLWVDEGVTWWNATHGTANDALVAEANHPPLWWLVTRAWLAAFGTSEFSMRLPAALCGVISVFLAFLLGRRLFDPARVPARGGFRGGDPAGALWVAGFAAGNAFWIEYSQEARMYSALLAESLGLSLLYLSWLDTGRRRALVGYAVLAALALHTHYFAIWPIAAHTVHALLVARSSRGDANPVRVRPLLVAQGVAGLLFLPWFLYLVRNYRGISTDSNGPLGLLGHALWRMGTGPGLVALDRPRVDAGAQAVFAEEAPIIVASAVFWLLPIALGVRALWKDRGTGAFVATSVLVPVGLVLLAAAFGFQLVHEKYLIFLAPFLLVLAVAGCLAATGVWKHLLFGGLVTLHIAGLAAYHAGDADAVRRLLTGDHVYGKEQWREAHAWVAGQVEKGDVVLLHAPFTHTVWEFYDARKPGLVRAQPIPPLELSSDRALTRDELLARIPALKTAKHAYLVMSHESADERDYYRGVLFEMFSEDGGSFPLNPEVFPRQWGIRVFQFARP